MFFIMGSSKPPENPLLGKDDILPPKWDFALRGMRVDELRKLQFLRFYEAQNMLLKRALLWH